MNVSLATSTLKGPIIIGVISFVIAGIGIYLLFLLIKAFRVHMKKNS